MIVETETLRGLPSLKLRAFVVMPYRKVEIRMAGEPSLNVPVHFDRVYSELLEPALRNAGCEPVRADKQYSADDIRTDMFFELVTADLVVADLPKENANVYYELGVR
jgi:hypothetical protein